LVNSMGYHLQSWREAFRNSQINVNEEEFRKDVYILEGLEADKTVRKLYFKYMGMAPSEDIIKKIVEDKRKIHVQLSSKAEPFEGVYDVLKYLNSCGVPMAMVTGSAQETAEKTVQRLFPSTFKVVVTGSDVDKGKPDPMPFLKAVDQLEIGNKEQCLVVENAPLGVQAARKAGIPVYGILMDSPLDPIQLEEAGAIRIFAGYRDLLREISELHFGTVGMMPNKALKRHAAKGRRAP
jgi:beta-phosphoglucomutase